MSESFLNGRVELHAGDCLDVLDTLPADHVHSVVCDPPYHLTTIVKRFGGVNAAPAKYGTDGAFARASAGFMSQVWDGGDVAFRTETWAKVLRVLRPGGFLVAFSSARTYHHMAVAAENAGFVTHPMIGWVTGQGMPKGKPIRDVEWSGWRYGTQAMKPALEPIYVGQKPFEHKLTGPENLRKWGVGALNIDACRVPSEGDPKGRWPANLVHDGSPEVLEAFPESPGQLASLTGAEPSLPATGDAIYGRRERLGFAKRGDSGSAARFYYNAKANADDRLGSKHPTVKPVDLMQWLVRLVTPVHGLILDPFAGTGTTGEAAWRENMRAILIEAEPAYQDDIRRRMTLCLAGPEERARESLKARGKAKGHEDLPLFGVGS